MWQVSVLGMEPAAFRLGQFFGDQSGHFLNGACVRDFVLNGEYVYKLNPFMSVNPREQNPVKFGCGELENQCDVGVEQGNVTSHVATGICINNSTCVHRWFDYECVGCKLPFYGKSCHLGKCWFSMAIFRDVQLLKVIYSYSYLFKINPGYKQGYNYFRNKFIDTDPFLVTFWIHLFCKFHELCQYLLTNYSRLDLTLL